MFSKIQNIKLRFWQKSQMKTVELKIVVTEIKNSLGLVED